MEEGQQRTRFRRVYVAITPMSRRLSFGMSQRGERRQEERRASCRLVACISICMPSMTYLDHMRTRMHLQEVCETKRGCGACRHADWRSLVAANDEALLYCDTVIRERSQQYFSGMTKQLNTQRNEGRKKQTLYAIIQLHWNTDK